MSFEPQLTIPQWLELPWETRHELIHLFAIPRSAGTETMNGKVLSDGHTHADLKHISVAKMQLYLDSHEEDFFALFNAVIQKVHRDMNESDDEMVRRAEEELAKQEAAKREEVKAALSVIAEATSEPKPKNKGGRPKKKV